MRENRSSAGVVSEPIGVLEEPIRREPSNWLVRLRARGRVTHQDRTIMTRQLSSLLSGGLTLMQATEVLIEHTEKQKMVEALMQVRNDLRAGWTFADAIAKHPTLFSPLSVSLIRSGEASGELPRILNWLADYMEKEQARLTQIRSALTYPIFLIALLVMALVVVLVFIIPRYVEIFQEVGQALPTPTRWLLSTSAFLTRWWWALVLAVVAAPYLYRLTRLRPWGLLLTDRLKLRLFLIGPLHLKTCVSRLARALSLMLMGGVPLLEALSLARDVVGNEVLGRALDEVRQRVREGERLAERLRQEGVFPPLLTRLVAVGDEAGSLPQVLRTVAETLDLEVDSGLKALVSLLEPFLIVTLGVFVAFVIFAVLLPILQLNALIGR
ncbi:MAG: type II secretion system F family protein [Armatimonadetes bacterium]|nr:type II secretion system F family protein [Armatimonadota bacterium]MDW8121008.1 type II secretion system F family protein [Armatimonadota bacterium]